MDTPQQNHVQGPSHWAIVPWLNSPEMTWQAVQDLVAQTLPTRVLLIGQGVSPEDRAWMDEQIDALEGEQAHQVIPWYCQPALPSLSALWNRALRFVWELGGFDALVVNNDVRLHPQTYQYLQRVRLKEDALFVSAVGVKDAGFALRDPKYVYTDYDFWDAHSDGEHAGFLLSRGGPDFSCFLITEAAHLKYPFDEHFSPAYCEDLDAHRRYMLGGDGHRIFSVNLPFLHFASGSVKAMSSEQRATFDRRFAQVREYYKQKWGGPVNQETTRVPFGPPAALGGPVTTPDLQRWWQAYTGNAQAWDDLRADGGLPEAQDAAAAWTPADLRAELED